MTASARPNTVQPAGSWTWVQWLTSGADSTARRGQALERRLSLQPACDGGRCEIAVTPDGANGTYLPDGYPPAEQPAPAGEPYTLTWNEAASMYELVLAPELATCTPKTGPAVPDGYETRATTSLRFIPGDGDRPAALRGTHTETVKGVGAAIAAKCPNYTTVWTVAAAPTQVATDDRVDLSGRYTVTEVIERVVPAGSRQPGFAGILLPTSTVVRSGSGYTVSGTGPTPAALRLMSSGWGGESVSSEICTVAGRKIPNGYTRTERWTQLRPVVSTENGQPVIVGRWLTESTLTASGVAMKCPPSRNKGYVIFVPLAALPTTPAASSR